MWVCEVSKCQSASSKNGADTLTLWHIAYVWGTSQNWWLFAPPRPGTKIHVDPFSILFEVNLSSTNQRKRYYFSQNTIQLSLLLMEREQARTRVEDYPNNFCWSKMTSNKLTLVTLWAGTNKVTSARCQNATFLSSHFNTLTPHQLANIVYHPNTGHLAGIGMVPALVAWYIQLVFFVL